MTDRERHILALQPQNPDPDQPLKWRETKEIIYFPKGSIVSNIKGDYFDFNGFEADFAKGITYQSRISTNQSTNTVVVELQLF